MFATPPCSGQRRLPIVVAAEITSCVLNCAFNVCWEGKKFRVICSHLNPGSVMHMCAGDLEDLRSLVTSRVKGHEPQIDYILSSDHNSLSSRIFDSSATASDHWGLTATTRAKRGKKPWRRHARKPIGWEGRDHFGFNNTVRAQAQR